MMTWHKNKRETLEGGMKTHDTNQFQNKRHENMNWEHDTKPNQTCQPPAIA